MNERKVQKSLFWNLDGHKDQYWYRDSTGLSVLGWMSSNGTAGAPGPSTPALGTLGRLRIDASSIPDNGLNTYQGRLQHISLLSRQDGEAVYMLTVCLDSKTDGRLKENLSGSLGNADMDDVESFPMTVTVEPSIT